MKLRPIEYVLAAIGFGGAILAPLQPLFLFVGLVIVGYFFWASWMDKD